MKRSIYLVAICFSIILLLFLLGCGTVPTSTDDDPEYYTGLLVYNLTIGFTGGGSGSIEVTTMVTTSVHTSLVTLEIIAGSVSLEVFPDAGDSFDWWESNFLTGAPSFATTAIITFDAITPSREIVARFSN